MKNNLKYQEEKEKAFQLSLKDILKSFLENFTDW